MGSLDISMPHRDFPDRDVILVGGGKRQKLEVWSSSRACIITIGCEAST